MPMVVEAAPRIGVTVGDPAGIGPEIALRAIAHPGVMAEGQVELLGARKAIERHAAACGLPVPGDLPIRDLPAPDGDYALGRVSAACGAAAAAWIEEGMRLCMSGSLDALVTCPVSKEAFAAAGLTDRGHTDLFARLLGGIPLVMFFRAPDLSVALLTDHVDLRTAIGRTRRDRIVARTRIVAREWGPVLGREPRLVLAGLNPHAGEGGLLGREEAEEMEPAVEDLRGEGVEVTGPVPAEHAYRRARAGEFDVVLAPYHDQGLVVVKTIAFGRSVHITLGLPFVRTSVDHGTAFGIAGRGTADVTPLVEAVRCAALMVRARRRAEP